MADSSRRELTVVLKGDGSGLTATLRGSAQDVEKLADQLDDLGKSSRQASEQTQQALDGIAASAAHLDTTLTDTAAAIRTAAGALVGLHLVREIGEEIVEANNKLTGWRQGLEAAAGSQQAGADSMAFIRAESQRLGLVLEDAAGTWVRLEAATKGTTLQGEKARAVFTSVAEAARVLHLSGEETNQALTALDQIISKGTVQTQELKLQLGNVLPGAMHIAAESIGKTTAELDKMLEQGELAADDFLPKFAARLHALYGATANEAANSPAAELNRLSNAVFELKAAVGDAGFMTLLASGARQATQALTSLVQSGGLDALVRGAEALAAVGLARVLSSWGTSALEYGRSVTQAMAAQTAAIAAEKAAAAADLEAAQAKSVNLTATLATIDAARSEATANLAAAQAEAVLAQRHLDAAKSAGVLSYAMREQQVAADRLTAAQARQSAAMSELAALGKAQAGVQSALSGAAAAQIAAQERMAVASTAASAAMTTLTRVGSGVLAMLGGWPGVALLAAGALVYLATRESDAEKAAATLTETTNQLAAAHGNVSQAAIDAAKDQVAAQQMQLQQAKATLEAVLASKPAYEGNAQGMQAWGVAADDAQKNVNVLQLAITKLNEQIRNSSIAAAFAENLGFLSRGAAESAQSFDQLTDSVRKQTEQLAEQVATFGKGKAALVEYQEQQAIAKEQAKGDTNETRARIAALKAAYAAQLDQAKALDALTAGQKAHTAAVRDSKKEAADELKRVNDIAGAYARAADLVNTLDGKNTDPISKAWEDSAKSARDFAEVGATLIKQGQDEASVQQLVAEWLTHVTDARTRAIAAAEKQRDVAGEMIGQMEQEARLAGLSERDQAIARAGMQAETKLRQGNLGLTEDQIAAQKAQVEAAAAGLYDVQKAMEQQQAYAQEFAGYWNNGVSSVSRAFGDLFTGQIDSARDFGRSLVDIAKQTASDMIAQFLRLRVIGPILNGALGGLGGGSSGLLAYAANYYGSGGTLGPAPGGDSAGTGGGGAPTSTSYASYLQQGLSDYRTYNTLKGWLTGGTGYATYGNTALNGSLATGYGNSVTAAQGYLGQYGATPTVYSGIGVSSTPTAVPWGGTYSIGGYTAPVASYAGGIAGALYGTQQGSGGLSTVGSTLSYGALGAGLAGTAAGVAGGASLGAAAGGAFGSIAAGTSWIPVVGWVLAAIAAVDAISGGKFFGTSYSPTESDSYLNLGPDGGSAQAFVTEKRQGALFSGAKYRTKEVAASAELQKAADQLYSAVSKSMVQGAQQLGVDVPAMINASLQTKVDINSKTGKVKSTEYLVNYLGETWKEATADAAAKRLGAEAIIATVQASAGDAVQGIANQFRDSADTLADAAQAMLAAQTDITKGNSLLALGSSATLAQVIEFVSELQQSGESLADAYQRVAQAGASYLQFVNQFKPTASTLGGSLQSIAQQMQANIDQANALAQAAGLQGAREQDLANIHQAAAQQAADALAQLSTAAQDLATKLYGATGTTLAAVQAQIDQVQAKLQSATQTAIGDLSPLSAKEKLDVALKGLRSGVTSASDVLQLGRQLYASGSDYNALYAKVMAITGQPATAADLGTQLDSYNGLVSQRDQLQAQADSLARFNDAKTLAQYVADISSAHGVSYGEAAQGLGFSLSDLAKDLGVTNLTGYLDTLQQQDLPGTVMTASSSIVDAIRDLGRDLLSTLTGAPLVDPGPAAPVSVGTSTPEQLALLQQINDKLAQLNATTFKVATSTGKTASNTSSSALRTVASSTR